MDHVFCAMTSRFSALPTFQKRLLALLGGLGAWLLIRLPLFATTNAANTLSPAECDSHIQRWATVAEISRNVFAIVNRTDLLPQIVNQIREGLGYKVVQIFLLDADQTHAHLAAATGKTSRTRLAARPNVAVGSDTVIGQALQRGEPYVVTHDAIENVPDCYCEMALPLVARGQLIGALALQSRDVDAFTADIAQVLGMLAEIVATAIDNARLLERADERADDMAFLFQVTNAAATSADLEGALAQVVETLHNTMNAAHTSVYLPAPDSDSLIRGATAGLQDENPDAITVPVQHGAIGWVARHLKPLMTGDLAHDPRFQDPDSTANSAIVIPLLTGDELTGVLSVESARPNAFDENDLHLLQMLSASLAAIIEKSQLLREMQTINEQLLEVDRLKTNFLAAMSHELRTPLNSIIGFSRVILKGIDGPLTDLQVQDITTIYDSGRHLLGLVNDLLDQAKLEAGRMKLVLDYFDLPQMINGVMATAGGLIQDKPIALHTAIDSALPQAYGDEFRTRQVLLNLVSNAAKFTEQGRITVGAVLIEQDGRSFVQVSVSDTGIGIAEEDISKLFEAFQQVDNSLTRKAGGTGMGLPLARSLTEMQHGRLWVESEVGSGSTFSFTLPTQPVAESDKPSIRPEAGDRENDGEGDVDSSARQDAGPDDAQGEPPTAHVAEAMPEAPAGLPEKGPLPTKIALVVENSEGAVNDYRPYLAPEGYDVVGVTDPTSVRFTLAVRPTVILLDVAMQDGAGWAVLKELSTIANAPVIVCSASHEPADRERGLSLGAAAYVRKPLSDTAFVETVRRIEAENAP